LDELTRILLDTALYEVEFEDGRVEAFHANQIADSFYARVDDEGYTVFEVDDNGRVGVGRMRSLGWRSRIL
jgi:hypothetical protein